MPYKINYTQFARSFATRYPLVSYTGIQVNFWILANTILVVIVYLGRMSVASWLPPPRISLGEMLVLAILYGSIYGSCQGITDYFVIQRLNVQGMLRLLLLRLLFSILLTIGLFFLTLYLFGDRWLIPRNAGNTGALNYGSVKYLLGICMIYYMIMNIVLIFINQMNTKYGPGILIPLLLGKYTVPVEEQRIFLFMDLHSSTTLAESLGHIRYSAFIRDSFKDINHLVSPYNAEVYQYVGDEIVLSWRMSETGTGATSIRFFFACEERFAERAAYYLKEYGAVPVFKAGIHCGTVTAVEIGDVKREIAYHGDILNTAARIQSLCNNYGAKFLASVDFIRQVRPGREFILKELGQVELRGKSHLIEIVSIESV